MSDARVRRFEQAALPHLDAAFNLARWLTGNDHDAADVVQDAYMRALRYFDGFQGGDARSWVMTIVRRTCYTWLGKNRPREIIALEDTALEQAADNVVIGGFNDPAPNPEQVLMFAGDRALLERLIAALPPAFREVVVLRELEDLPYRDIAAIVGVPVGTVMSRLARARRLMRDAWGRRDIKEASGGL